MEGNDCRAENTSTQHTLPSAAPNSVSGALPMLAHEEGFLFSHTPSENAIGNCGNVAAHA